MITYLDNAATTFYKPDAVYKEVLRCMKNYCGNPGRGSHFLSLSASEKIYECRCALGSLFNFNCPEQIFFTLNTTYALNTAIKGLLKKGDHAIISDMEHNAVYRPIYGLASKKIIDFDIFSTETNSKERSPKIICQNIEKLIKSNTKALICSHSSNICSASLPLKEIGKLCKAHGIVFIVDGAQSAGHTEIDMKEMGIDILCVPSHKGLYGPQGAGVVCLSKSICLDTLVEGGNGVNSLDGFMPEFSPERYESGTLPTPCIAGLCEGIKEINSIGIPEIEKKERELFSYAFEVIGNIKNSKVYLPCHKGSVLLFNISGIPSDIVAQELDRYSICVRGGFHCSALGHRTLGTPDSGGVRLSFGIYNKKEDIDKLYIALKNITK